MKKNKRKSNTKKNLPRKESFQLWLDSHKLLGFFLVFGLTLGIGLGVNLVFKLLPIPSPYRDINYSFPLYSHLVLKKHSRHSKIFGTSLNKSVTFFFKTAQACSMGFKSGE